MEEFELPKPTRCGTKASMDSSLGTAFLVNEHLKQTIQTPTCMPQVLSLHSRGYCFMMAPVSMFSACRYVRATKVRPTCSAPCEKALQLRLLETL